MREHPHQQGTLEWLEARRGVITGSRCKDARDRSTGLTEQQAKYVEARKAGKTEAEAMKIADYKAPPKSESVAKAIAGTLELEWSGAARAYAQDVARERCGGKAPDVYQNAAMRIGVEEEQFAVIEYVARTGARVDEAYFITTDDGKFGCSLDRWVGGKKKAALEVKTMVSSGTLFKAMVDGDISEYRDQCLFAIWLLVLEWIDLVLWCPDLQAMHVVRIHRDEAAIEALEDDLMAFERMVSEYEAALRKAMAPSAPVPETAASGKPAADMDAPWDMSSVGVTPKPALEPTF